MGETWTTPPRERATSQVGETFGETLVCFAITTQPLIQRASGLFFMFIVVHTRVCRTEFVAVRFVVNRYIGP